MQNATGTYSLTHSLRDQVSIGKSADWVAYYRHNDKNLISIPWEIGAELSDQERMAIAKSVQDFQLGESSEGRHLQNCAEEWGRQNQDAEYSESIRLFIREEQRHARELGRFLELNGIELIGKAWTDSLFRRLRHLAGLEMSIMVLLTAEIVAQVYYAALRESTQSQVLKTICDQILRDEEQHVRFQCERLSIIARTKPWIRLCLRYFMQRALMLGALPIVWISHRHAYRAGGYSFGRFVSETWLAFDLAVPRMHPRFYKWA